MLPAETLRKLGDRQEELAALLIAETDTSTWPTVLTERTLRDIYRWKRNAAATATLVTKIQTILDVALRRQPVDPKDSVPGDDEDDEPTEVMVERAHELAKQIMARHAGRFSKKP